MTPYPIAQFMAQRAVTGLTKDVVRILEPAAGAGALAAAVVQELLRRNDHPARIELTLFEIDVRLKPFLRRLADRMRRMARDSGVELSCKLIFEDFLLSPLARSANPLFDICIANPPYFKLKKADERAIAHAYAVHGQPNIYGLFQAACAGLVSPGGRWCFITPRSWMNGAYFAAVRRHLLHYLSLDAFHLFESRQDHFYEDVILQEAVIAWATAQPLATGEIAFSTSEGVADLNEAQLFALPQIQVIGSDDQRMIAVPVAAGAEQEGNHFDGWTDTLSSLGLQVSTGPVVPFRSTEFVLEVAERGSVPLLWMQHITHAGVRWPIQKKREHILSSAKSAWMLLKNMNYVVMRRFSPKEDARRVTAASYLGTLPGPFIGFENHLNYIHRPGGTISRDETVGITAFLNSTLVDGYFRRISGNTQVNATELRKLRFPDIATLKAIGRRLPDAPTLAASDAATFHVLGVQPDGVAM
jgi:adenine-specific DNA-methyltransferase